MKKNIKVKKPWGNYKIIKKENNYWIKELFIKSGCRLSLQSHKKRWEIWIVLDGIIEATKGTSKIKMKKFDFIKINKNQKHRIKGIKDSIVLEVAYGEVRERDIYRYEDDYGRIK